MPRDEKQTRVELIDPTIHDRGWNEALIREEKTPGGPTSSTADPEKEKAGRTTFFAFRLW